MEEQDQTWTQWKKSYNLSESNERIGRLKPFPKKPEAVIEFESMKPKEKQSIRDSQDWSEIARYYDELNNIVQENFSNAGYLMATEQMPIGKIPYLHGYYIQLINKPTPPEQQWCKGPEGIYHKPGCFYRDGRFKDPKLCECYRIRPKALMKKRDKVEIDDEAPF